MIRISRMAALFALAAAAACTDRGAFDPTEIPQPQTPLAAVQCQVTVRTGQMRCDVPLTTGSAMGDLMIGGQGTYVQLRSSNARYDSATEVFTIDVTLQNLLGQPVGTENGTDATGIRIFFHAPPVASVGSGSVEVSNPDGHDIFTEAGQPYFLYPEVLAPYERTAAKPWSWTVPLDVEQFTFGVYVSARVPNEQGVLRWTREQGDVVTRDLYTIWGTGPNDIWAAGGGVMMYNNGTRWTVIPGDWKNVSEIHGSGTDDVWAVGGGFGEIHHFDGRRWRLVPAFNENWGAVWAQSPSNAYIIGHAWGNVIRWNGARFDTVFAAVYGRRFWDVWGFGANDVYMTGGWWNTPAQRYDAFMYHWNGAAWDSTALSPSQAVGTIWGTSPDNLYGLGGEGVRHWNGTSWTQVITTPYGLREIWGSGPNDVWAVGGGYHNGGPEGTVLHYDGVSWKEIHTGAPATVAGVFAPNPDKVYLVGYRGMIHKRSGGQWVAETSATQSYIAGVTAVSETDAITAQCGGLRRNTGPGGAWQTLYATDDCLEKVWVTPGASQIFAVGDGAGEWGMRQGVIVRWDGAQWSRTVMPNTRYLHGVFGLDSAHVYAVGSADSAGWQVPRVLRWDGTAWTEINTGQEKGQLYGVWGTSPDDLWVVGEMVLHWDGERWDRKYVHEWSDNYTDVWGTGPDNVFLSGGRVARWDGVQWTSIYPRLNYQGTGVWGSGPNDVYVVGSQTLHWNGSSWTEVNIETGSSLADISGVTGRHVWAVGAGNTIMRGRR